MKFHLTKDKNIGRFTEGCVIIKKSNKTKPATTKNSAAGKKKK